MPPPPPSEWGKTGNGRPFRMVYLDLDRCLKAAGLGPNEWLLLGCIMDISWQTNLGKKGPAETPEPLPANPSLSALERATGVPRQRFQEAQKSLLSKRIITRTEDGYYINKNACEWTDLQGRPLLSKPLLDYARKGRTRKGVAETSMQKGARSTVQGGARSTVQGGARSTVQGGARSTVQGGCTVNRAGALIGTRAPAPAELIQRDFKEDALAGELADAHARPAGLGDVAAAYAELFGPPARPPWGNGSKLVKELNGRLDLYVAALREIKRRLEAPNPPAVKSVHGLARCLAAEYLEHGIPPEPTPIEAAAKTYTLADYEREYAEKLARYRGEVTPNAG